VTEQIRSAKDLRVYKRAYALDCKYLSLAFRTLTSDIRHLTSETMRVIPIGRSLKTSLSRRNGSFTWGSGPRVLNTKPLTQAITTPAPVCIRAASPAWKSRPGRTSSLPSNSSNGPIVRSPVPNWFHHMPREISTWWWKGRFSNLHLCKLVLLFECLAQRRRGAEKTFLLLKKPWRLGVVAREWFFMTEKTFL
jgi:hypothetical protein